MNRDIKFRGLDIENSIWIIGSIIKKENHFTWIYPQNQETLSFTNLVQVKTETVGQYTGLNDKNGKEIFEGDIIEFRMNTHQGTYRGKVIFEKGCFILEYKIIGGFREYLYQTSQAEEQFEIIGNIYETPHLL